MTVEDLTEEALLRAFGRWRSDMRKRPQTSSFLERTIDNLPSRPPRPDAPKIDTSAYELLAKLVAEALRRAKKEQQK